MPKAAQAFADLSQDYHSDPLQQWEAASHSGIIGVQEDMQLERLDALLLILFVASIVALAAFAITMVQTWS